MFFEIITAVICGVCAGIITGLIPGIHINLVSLILLSLSGYFLGFTSPIVLACFIIAMSITHTFLDSIPSIFLGAPDADTALAVLPGHQLLLEGRGYEAVKLTVIGSLCCLILVIAIIPFLIPVVPAIYKYIEPFMAYILIAVSVYMVSKEGNWLQRFWGLFVFLSSGILGLIVLTLPNVKQPLFPMLSGLFGISTLLYSLSQKVTIPNQKITEDIKIPRKNTIKALSAATFSGSLTGIFPGLGAAQAAILSMNIVGNIGNYAFLILIGGINTVNFAFSLVTLYTLQKARNGAVVAVMEIVKSIDINGLITFLAVALIAGGLATFLVLLFTRIFSRIITKVNYRMLCFVIISFITVLTFYFSSWIGLLILIVSTAIGLIAPITGVKRSNAMGSLLLPVILFFLL